MQQVPFEQLVGGRVLQFGKVQCYRLLVIEGLAIGSGYRLQIGRAELL